MSITLHKGSILDSAADYIVNPANSFLRHGGGLAAVIEAAATEFDPQKRSYYPMGIERWHEEHASAPLIPTGDAYMTCAGALRYIGVIHAVGPIWKDGHRFLERELLELAYESALELVPADSSVALPAISAGIFGAPIEEVARIAIGVAGWYSKPIEFWLFSDEHYAAFEKEAVEAASGWSGDAVDTGRPEITHKEESHESKC